jgi:hypothetical protein
MASSFHRNAVVRRALWKSQMLKNLGIAGIVVVQGLGLEGVGFEDGSESGSEFFGTLQIPPICCRITNSSYCSQISAIFPSLIWKNNISLARMVRGGSSDAG